MNALEIKRAIKQIRIRKKTDEGSTENKKISKIAELTSILHLKKTSLEGIEIVVIDP
jgi:hypothetical protein